MMTEEESFKKVCPISFINNKKVFNQNCIGSDCMAWIWDHCGHWTRNGQKTCSCINEGHCGLVES